MKPRPNGYKQPHDKDPDGIVEWCLDAVCCLMCLIFWCVFLHVVAPDVVPSAYELYAMVRR